MSEETTTDIGTILRRVRAMLDKAESTESEFPAEAATYREKAETLMRKYRIAEETILAQDPTSVEPIVETITVAKQTSSYWQQYWDLINDAARHTGIRVRGTWVWDASHALVLSAQMVGYESDVRYAELIFTAARVTFANKLEPKVDRNLSDEENIYRMRSAGIERNRVAHALWGSEMTDGKAHGKVARIYKAECAARGEQAALDGRGVSARVYREEYANGFVRAFDRRLRAARDAADGVGGVMVLAGRAERVNEKFYTLFPELRPAPEGAEEEKPKGKKKPAKPYRVSKADLDRWERRNGRAGQAGRAAGTAAAQEVQVERASNAQRLDQHDAENMKMVREIQNWTK